MQLQRVRTVAGWGLYVLVRGQGLYLWAGWGRPFFRVRRARFIPPRR